MSSKFTTVYEKARDVMSKQAYAEPDWKKFIEDKISAKAFFGANGFSIGHVDAPELLRAKLKSDSRGKLTAAILGGGQGDVVHAACQNDKSSGNWKERAAALVMLRQTYRASNKGGQGVWVYNPPKAHTKHVFDELVGRDDTVKSKIAKTSGIFGSKDMKLMVDALAVANKTTMDALAKVTRKSDAAKEKVKHWFLEDGASEEDLNDALDQLGKGLKKIAGSCGSSCLVFTDYIDWRKQRNDYFGAAFAGGEGGGFPIIYLEGAFTRLKGNSGKLWLCAQTIVHELSHHDISTKDHRYDHHGLKPTTSFPYAKTIDNADNWGYFVLDIAGYLSKSDRDTVWK